METFIIQTFTWTHIKLFWRSICVKREVAKNNFETSIRTDLLLKGKNARFSKKKLNGSVSNYQNAVKFIGRKSYRNYFNSNSTESRKSTSIHWNDKTI